MRPGRENSLHGSAKEEHSTCSYTLNSNYRGDLVIGIGKVLPVGVLALATGCAVVPAEKCEWRVAVKSGSAENKLKFWTEEAGCADLGPVPVQAFNGQAKLKCTNAMGSTIIDKKFPAKLITYIPDDPEDPPTGLRISDVSGGGHDLAASIQLGVGVPVVFDCEDDALVPLDCSDPDTECATEYKTVDSD